MAEGHTSAHSWIVDADDQGPLLADAAGETRTSVGFIGPQDSRLFTIYHAPQKDVRAAVLICPPICAEATRNYRREVLLARILAQRGVAVLRFHYRGAGNSDGSSFDLSFASMIEDAASATDHLRSVTGLDRIGFIGTRLGGTVAGRLAAHHDGTPVALWEPVAAPDRYFREVLRARMMTDLKRNAGRGSGMQGLIAQLKKDGFIDVCGYPITEQLYESAMQFGIEEALGPKPRPLFVVEMNGVAQLRKGTEALTVSWRRAGFSVETHVATPAEPWWFGASGTLGSLPAGVTGKDVVAVTADFLERWLTRNSLARSRENVL